MLKLCLLFLAQFDFPQIHLKDKSCIWWDSTGDPLYSIAERRGDHQETLSPLGHTHHTLVPALCVCVGGSVMCGGDSECITLMTFPLPTLNLNDLSVLALLSNTCKPSHDSHMSTHQCTKHAFPKVLFSKIHPVYLTSTESPLSTDCEGSCGGHVCGG